MAHVISTRPVPSPAELRVNGVPQSTPGKEQQLLAELEACVAESQLAILRGQRFIGEADKVIAQLKARLKADPN
jgi:hypothetical protein